MTSFPETLARTEPLHRFKHAKAARNLDLEKHDLRTLSLLVFDAIIERMLTATQRDYPPASLTAALAEALSAVLHVCDRQHAIGQSAISVRTVTEALVTPLNAFLEPWADDKPADTSGDESDGAAGAAEPAPSGSEVR